MNIKTRTIGKVLEDLKYQLSFSEEAALEARLLVCHVLGLKWGDLIVLKDNPLPSNAAVELERLLSLRRQGWPIQYLLGSWEFMGLPFLVREGVLIPRQDTETLVEIALEQAKANAFLTALDVCTGSGCIAVSLAKLGGLKVCAVDISSECIKLAGENAQLNGACIELLEGDLYAPVCSRRFDMILSNPPYIPSQQISRLQKEVTFEPELALNGGPDGLDFYKRIIPAAITLLSSAGMLAVECGISQAHIVAGMFEKAGFNRINSIKDLAGIERVVYGFKS